MIDKFRNWLKLRQQKAYERNLIHCPNCNSAQLSRMPGMSTFQVSYMCVNGHNFSERVEGY